MIRKCGKNSAVSGVYVIRCLANGKVYIGSSKNMLKRVEQHKSKLRRGEHDLPRLQKDWDFYGEELFEFERHSFAEREMRDIECQYIEELGALEHQSGYNKMVGGKWGPEARIRNTEIKLLKKRKYCPLRSIDRESPMALGFIQTFCHSF